MKKRLCFIIPYFGKLPNYFPLFLKSCKANPNFNWIVFTDDDGNYDYPDNVLKVKMTFKECQTLVKSKFECKRVRDAAFFLIIMLVTFAATLLKPQKYVSSRTIQKCVEHVSTST